MKKLEWKAAVTVRCQKQEPVVLTEERTERENDCLALDFGDGGGITCRLWQEAVSGGIVVWAEISIKNESCRENRNLEMERPVEIRLEWARQPEAVTAMYLFNDWWTRPAFVKTYGAVPENTQALYLKYRDGYGYLMPMAGKRFKTYVRGGGDQGAGKNEELVFVMTAAMAGIRSFQEPVFVMTESAHFYDAVDSAFSWAAGFHGLRKRKDRRYPEVFSYLGWCSWDAFYTDITEEKVRQKAQELKEKHVPVRWLLMDDGWLSTREELLGAYEPDREKFPEGFGRMITEIKEDSMIRWFGVWHALGGYWGGVDPESPLADRERESLCESMNGKLLPWPETGKGIGFYRDWYAQLKRAGIDFVKVDGQSAVKNYFENSRPLCEAARGIHGALESAAAILDGALINCMGMAVENMMSRAGTAISRNSDDFVPDKEEGFTEHLMQNAYNSVYHDALYYCDYDMFWTNHPHAAKHSLLRAVSGGPVYFSDRIGETDENVLKPLGYSDGRLPLLERAAKPSVDCLFDDPRINGVLTLTNIGRYGEGEIAGSIAAFAMKQESVKFEIGPEDIPDLPVCESYYVYDYFRRRGEICQRNQRIEKVLEGDGYGWYLFLPVHGECAVIGLTDIFISFHAIDGVTRKEGGMSVIFQEGGEAGFYCRNQVKRASCDGTDIMEELSCRDGLYHVKCGRSGAKMALTIGW